MAFQNTPPINFAEFGLVTDVPSNSTPPAVWTSCLNVRAKDDSVQGVNAFTDSFSIGTASYPNGKPIAVTQWTPAGSTFLNIAYIIDDGLGGNKGRVFVYNSSTQATVEITSSTDPFTIDENYPPQIFVFNEILVVNPATGNPQYISADATTGGVLADLPGWNALTLGNSYPRIMRAFNNRLIAMNWHDVGNDTNQPIDFVWSSVVTAIGSLATVKWQAASDNTAGDAFLTATPGAILDGIQVGNTFFAGKSDAIIAITETGDAIYPLRFDSIFEDDGVYSTGCMVNIGNSEALIVGNYGVKIIDGNGQSRDIAKGMFQEALFALINPLHKERSFLFQQTRDKEVWFCLSTRDNTDLGCDRAFVYDYSTEKGKLHIRTLPQVRDLHETEINGELKIYGASPENTNILELSDSLVESDGTFTVEDKFAEDGMTVKEVLTMSVNAASSIKLAITGTFNLQDAKAYTDFTFDPSNTYKTDVRESGRYFSLRFTMDGANNPKLTTIVFRMRMTGRR